MVSFSAYYEVSRTYIYVPEAPGGVPLATKNSPHSACLKREPNDPAHTLHHRRLMAAKAGSSRLAVGLQSIDLLYYYIYK